MLILSGLFFVVIGGQTSATPTTTATITVTYTFTKPIALTAGLTSPAAVSGLVNTAGLAQGSIPATIQGDRTHTSYLASKVQKLDDDPTGKTVRFQFHSPGHSGTETLSLANVSFKGNLLIVTYTKISPEVNTDDFRQFASTILVTFK